MIVKCEVLETGPHENADRLLVTKCDIGRAKPIQVVTNLVETAVGDALAVALHGHLMPDGFEPRKIRRSKLRGVLSEGMFVSQSDLAELYPDSVNFVATTVGGVLVEDPEIVEAAVPAGSFKKVSEIRNGYQLDLSVFVDREVVVMEKMDGSSHRVGFRRGLDWCGGHNHVLAIGAKVGNDGFGFGEFVSASGIADRLQEWALANGVEDIALYGEFCGPKIQKNFYELSERGFFVFDIAIGEQWQGWDRIVEICTELKLDVVPVDFLGAFDLDLVNEIIARRSQFGEEMPREGVVVKLREEGRFADDTRAIFKHKPEQRQERKSHRKKLSLSAEEIAFNSLRETVADYVTGERAEHAIAHLTEAGTAITFPAVVGEMQQDILKEAATDHLTRFRESEKDFRKIVGKLVGQSGECKARIFAAMEA